MPDLAAAPGATAQETAPRARRLLRGLLAATGLASLTALVFAGALAATMPASFLGSLVALPPQVEGLSGSAWRGRASLAGGHALSWQVSGRDVWRLRLLADASLEGPDTQLVGRLAATPWQVTALGWTGRAGPGLLALAPRLAVEGCTSRAVVEVARLALGRSWAAAEGRVDVIQGDCLTRDGAEVPVPAMTLDLVTEGRDARAVLRSVRGATLATLGVTGERTLQVRVEPEGAALVPGMPSSAATTLEYPF
jgi:hypothetical protein